MAMTITMTRRNVSEDLPMCWMRLSDDSWINLVHAKHFEPHPRNVLTFVDGSALKLFGDDGEALEKHFNACAGKRQDYP